jgi:hypothetical protein
VSCIVIFFYGGGKASTPVSIANMVTENQSSCFMIIILAAVFLMFYKSSKPTNYRGTECSARKTDNAKNVSARSVDDDDDETPTDPSNPFDFVPLSKEGEEQFANLQTNGGKTPTDIRKLEANIREPVGDEVNLARFRGMEITGTLASCTGGTKDPTTKPTKDTMFMLPAAFS